MTSSSANLGILYATEKTRMGMMYLLGDQLWESLKNGWQTVMYRSIAIAMVVYIEPVRKEWSNDWFCQDSTVQTLVFVCDTDIYSRITCVQRGPKLLRIKQ